MQNKFQMLIIMLHVPKDESFVLVGHFSPVHPY